MTETHRPFHIEAGFRPEHRRQAAEGYWEAFARKLRYPLGPRHRAVTFIERVLDPAHAISAVSDDGLFLGVAGFKTARGAFVGGTIADLAAVYGWPGAAVRGLLVSLLERSCEDGTLLMDGIFVAPAARDRGVGTALLTAVERHAAACGLARIRLDVIDRNPRARALYERHGYGATATAFLGPLHPLFGFKSSTTMLKAVNGA
ncbi:GNAT family N-acetyltransferase [Caenispirillum salinarum]|uniref:GNAT family N-acetyltransferase n=1 Tax=Caenispirillum salinarum TaxID=859058 RepID=UPI0038518065